MPVGDADNLRADLDDGYAKVANLLLEALCCAPLSAAEYAVVLFIIRRTYGWAKYLKRDSGKVDAMTAEQIAEGTALSRSGVHKALQSLTSAHVILRDVAKAGNYFSYGMNPDVAQWGTATPDWKTCKQQLRDARDGHTYNRNGLEVSPKRVRGLTQTGHRSTPSGSEVHGFSPTGTGANGTLQRVLQTRGQTGGQNASTTPPPTDPPAPPLPPSNERGCKRSDGPMLLQNYACLATAVRQVYGGHWSQTKQNDFVCDAGAALAEPGCTVTEDDAIAALLGDGKPTPGQRGDWWVGNLCKAKATRASPTRRGRSPSAPAAPEKFAAAVEELGLEVEPDATDPLADE